MWLNIFLVFLIFLGAACAYIGGRIHGINSERRTWEKRSKSVVCGMCGMTVYAEGIGDIEITGEGFTGNEDTPVSERVPLIYYVKVVDLEKLGGSFADAPEEWVEKHEVSATHDDLIAKIKFARAARYN